MRIGFEIEELCSGTRAGLYWYRWNLLSAFQEARTAHQFTLFHSLDGDPQRQVEIRRAFPAFRVKQFRQPGRPYRLRLSLDSISRQDVFHYVSFTHLPILPGRANVFLIPDLGFIHYPQFCANRDHWMQYLDLANKHANLIVTFSEHTKWDVVSQLGIEPGRISAIPLAADSRFCPPDDDEKLESALRGWGLKRGHYLLSVGTLEPRKNHVLILKAFARLCAKGLDHGQVLVFAGARGWLYDDMLETISALGLQESVKLLGHAERLELLYAGASLLVYPSFYEGFGLPPLEAMACGTPVIVSNASSLPEVVGDAAATIDPRDEQSLAETIAQLLADSRRREQLRELGLKRASQFTWKRTAELTLEAYHAARRVHAGQKC